MISREEVLRIAQECGFEIKEYEEDQWFDQSDDLSPLERFAAAIYEAGAAEKEELLKAAEEDIQRKRDHIRFSIDQLAAERAVSDKLLEALKSIMSHPTAEGRTAARAVIAEVEAIRKEQE